MFDSLYELWRCFSKDHIERLFMKRQNRVDERRKSQRLEISIPLSISLHGTATSTPPINVETGNISPDGLSILIGIRLENKQLSLKGGERATKVIPYLSLNDKVLELGIKILPKGGRIKGIGKVMWYDRCVIGEYYYLRAGLHIDRMAHEDRGKWLEFVRAVAQIQNQA
jgi:hypothetical protein